MKGYLNGLVTLAALGAASTAAPAAVLITEVLYNEVGSNTAGEWVEIMNTGAAPVDISSYKIGDEEAQGGDAESGGMWQFPAGTTLAAGQVIVVGVSAAQFNTNYGILPSFELTGSDPSVPDMVPYLAWVSPAENINMSNSNDQAVLLAPDDSVADAVGWGNTFAFDPGLDGDAELDGQSYRRITQADTNSAGDWELSPDTGAAATRSSPFVAPPVPEPTGLAAAAAALWAGLLARRRRSAR